MGKGMLLICSNIRKAKVQTTTILVLIFLAALMLNLWLMLAMDYKQNFDRYHDKLNAEHIMLAADGDRNQMQEFLTQTLEADARTDNFCLDDVMLMVGSFPYNSGKINSNFVILDKQTALSRSVGRLEFVEDSTLQSGIYLPLLYKSDDVAVGKEITIAIGSNEITYTICGFFNSIMAGSHNCAVCELVLTADKFSELEGLGYASQATLCSIRLTDKAESADFESALNDALYSRYPQVYAVSNTYTLVVQSRYISQMICSGIMSAGAFLILLIALVVIASNIANYIQENMKNLGVLKAVGYTSRQLIAALLLQFAGLSLIAAVAGAGVSYILFPSVNTMMISQTGIPYGFIFCRCRSCLLL